MRLLPRAHGLLLRLARRWNPFVKRLPRRITLTMLVPEGCVFEVTTPIEEARVAGLGEESEFLRLLLDDVKPGCCLFDIGSCVGLYALHAALRGAPVVAFEPDPAYRARLQRNIEINRLTDRVKVIPWAVSEEKGTAVLYTDGVEGNSPSLALVGDRGSVSVSTDSIDNAMAAGSLPAPDIIKLDIEGAEIQALRGMTRLLRSEQAPRHIYLELHPAFLQVFGATVQDCVTILESSGYARTHWQTRADQIHCVYGKA